MRRYPAVVVAYANGGIQEQVAGLQTGTVTVKSGYITIAADAAYLPKSWEMK